MHIFKTFCWGAEGSDGSAAGETPLPWWIATARLCLPIHILSHQDHVQTSEPLRMSYTDNQSGERAYFVLGPFCVWGQIKHLLFPMLCLVGQHTSPLLPFVVPNLPHKPPLCCQLLLHPQIKSAHYCPLYKCAHKHTQLLLLKHCFIHTLKYILTT